MLSITGLNKTFPLRPEPILNDITLDLEAGEFCILLGSNGSGKSTLLKTILGECKADSGSIRLGGMEISHLATYQIAALIGSVVQEVSSGTIGSMTLLENLAMSYLRGKKPSLSMYSGHYIEMHQLVESLGFGLEKHLNTPMERFSGGQRQIISTLMATISNTKLLLLDEHTSALDPRARVALMKYTAAKIDSKDITALMVTHNFSDAIEYGSRIIILHQGKIAYDISGHAKLTLTKEHLLRLFHSLDDRMH